MLKPSGRAKNAVLTALETQFEENEIRIGDLTEQLDKRLGSLRELFGVLQQVAGDTRGLFEASLISSQYADRGEWLGQLAKKMGTASQLATIAEMEDLWFELQREMTESGKIAKYPGNHHQAFWRQGQYGYCAAWVICVAG